MILFSELSDNRLNDMIDDDCWYLQTWKEEGEHILHLNGGSKATNRKDRSKRVTHHLLDWSWVYGEVGRRWSGEQGAHILKFERIYKMEDDCWLVKRGIGNAVITIQWIQPSFRSMITTQKWWLKQLLTNE